MINDGKGPGGSTLLCFAHKGEAQCFFQHFSFIPHHRFHDAWVSSELTLVITGEGVDAAMTKVALILGAHPEIQQVINLGVAGAIRDEIKLHQIIKVRSVYGEDRFHSFDLKGDIDVLTTNNRVLESQKAQKLRAFAPVVDRELWGIARACKEAKLNLIAIKIISDLVSTEQKEICIIVREKALYLSEKLLEAYFMLRPVVNDTAEIENQSNRLFQNEHFHFSKVQQRQTQRLLDQLHHKKNCIETFIQAISSLPKRPKDRARLLIEECQKILFPLEHQVKEALYSCAKKDLDLGIEVQFDSNLEDSELLIKVRANNAHQWQQNLRALDSFHPERYWKILRGEIDV